MIIQTLKHTYNVIQKVVENETTEQFLCKNMDDENDATLYRVVKICDRNLTVKLIVSFHDQEDNKSFKDYYDSFTQDGCLYLVFIQDINILLTEKLEDERCLLEERLTIMKNILEKIILLNMPEFLLYDVLDKNKITVSKALDVNFIYDMEEFDELHYFAINDCSLKIAALVRTIFSREIDLMIGQKLPDFVDHLEEAEFDDYYQIYAEYLDVMNWYLDKNNLLKPNSFWHRVWEKIKAFWKKAKPIIFILIFLFLLIVLAVNFLKSKPSTKQAYDYDRIGNLQIIYEEH